MDVTQGDFYRTWTWIIFKEHSMGRVFFAIAVLFFFLAAVGANFIPNPTAWGLVSTALGLAVGAWIPWRKGTA